MNHRLAILFASFCILVFFGSCQKRYGHVKKVKRGEKIAEQHRSARLNKLRQQEYFTLESKTPLLSVNSFTDSMFVNVTPAPPHQKTARKNTIRNRHITAENDSPEVSESFYPPHPNVEDVKLGNSNFNEVANVSLIVGLVIILLLLLFLLGAFAVSGITAAGFLAAAAAEDIFLAGLGVALIYPIIWLTRRLYKDLQDDYVRYGGVNYPLKDVKHMPGQVQIKRAWHNFITAILLTGIGSLLFFFGILFLPGVIWFFFKLLYTIFFVERY